MGLFRKKDKEPPRREEPEVLVESWSPVCNIQAFAEDNGSCVYFYLWRDPGTDRAQLKSCWVCNRGPAPEGMDKAAMDRGEAPRMPRSGCGHDPAGVGLDRGRLSILWLEEGDAAALLEGDKILALIPGWAWREEDFSGYARYAAGRTSLAWALSDAEAVLSPRVERSRAYWAAMEGDFWPELQEGRLSAMTDFFGEHEQYYAIDGGNFPPRALVTGRRNGVRYAFTLGVSILCQPVVERYWPNDDPAVRRRIELAFAAREELPEEQWMAILGRLSGAVNIPWREITCLGHGHTITCGDALPGFPAVFLADTRRLPDIPAPDFPPFMGEPVTLLWAIPITQREYDVALQSQEAVLPMLCQGPKEEIAVFTGEAKFIQK